MLGSNRSVGAAGTQQREVDRVAMPGDERGRARTLSSARARRVDDCFGRSRSERIFITLILDLIGIGGRDELAR